MRQIDDLFYIFLVPSHQKLILFRIKLDHIQTVFLFLKLDILPSILPILLINFPFGQNIVSTHINLALNFFFSNFYLFKNFPINFLIAN